MRTHAYALIEWPFSRITNVKCTLQKRRLRWFGHVQHMENVSRARQALHWIPTEKEEKDRELHRETK